MSTAPRRQFPEKMDRDTFWATFSQSHLVTLVGTTTGFKNCPLDFEFKGVAERSIVWQPRISSKPGRSRKVSKAELQFSSRKPFSFKDGSRRSSPPQGCQMVYFQTKNPNLGKLWRVLEWKRLVYFMVHWKILWPFGIFCGHLVI
jgi:hypothetical protein